MKMDSSTKNGQTDRQLFFFPQSPVWSFLTKVKLKHLSQETQLYHFVVVVECKLSQWSACLKLPEFW